jgi:hypothetical protein
MVGLESQETPSPRFYCYLFWMMYMRETENELWHDLSSIDIAADDK